MYIYICMCVCSQFQRHVWIIICDHQPLVYLDIALTLDTAKLGQATQRRTSLIGTGACPAGSTQNWQQNRQIHRKNKMFQVQKVHLVFGNHWLSELINMWIRSRTRRKNGRQGRQGECCVMLLHLTKFLDVLKNHPNGARCMFLGTVTGSLPIGAFSSRCSSCRQQNGMQQQDVTCGNICIWKNLEKSGGNRIGHQFKKLKNYKRVKHVLTGARSRKHTRHPSLVSWMLKRSIIRVPTVEPCWSMLNPSTWVEFEHMFVSYCFKMWCTFWILFVPFAFHQHVYFKMSGVLCL